MALTRLIGEDLILPPNNDNLAIDDFVNTDECSIVGFYIVSANCPQCVDFSQQLLSFYQARLESQKVPKLKIISVSLEEDDDLFAESLQNLPWPAINRTARHKKARILRKLRLKAVAPALALVEAPSGRLVTPAARDRILDAPDSFPWRTKPLKETLSEVELRGSISKYTDLQGIKGFYFSANWCPPCKAFTPQLADAYQSLKDRGHAFEIVFVSSDRSEASFEQSVAGMPWLAVPWSAEAERRELAATLGVQGIPSLVLVDKHDEVITDEARAELADDPLAKVPLLTTTFELCFASIRSMFQYFPWPARRVCSLNERTAVKLQDGAALVLLVESEEELETAETALQPVAEEFWSRSRRDETDDADDELRFLVGCDSETTDALREFAGLEDVVPLVAILDVTSQRVATLEDGSEVTTENIRRFVDSFLSDKLTWCDVIPPQLPDPSNQSPCSPATPVTHTHTTSPTPAAPC